jgi:hypothetical protein
MRDVFRDPDEGEDVLAFGDTEPRIPRRTKRLAVTGTVVAGAAVAVGLLVFQGTNHAPAPPRSATQSGQTTSTITACLHRHGNWIAAAAIPASTVLPAGTSRTVKLNPATGHRFCP